MWKQIIDLVRQVLLLNESTKRNQDGLAELQKQVRDLSRTTDQNIQRLQSMIERLVYEVKRLDDELRHMREREADAREKLRLEMENKLLKESRQLPPASEEKEEKGDSA